MTSARILRLGGLGLAVAGLALLVWAMFFRDPLSRQEVVLVDLGAIAASEAATQDAPNDFPAIIDSAVRDPQTRSFPVGATLEIIEVIPHDESAFTQGLEITANRLFESTGLFDESTIRELDIDTGEVLRRVDVEGVFAEGLTIDGSTALQLTWRDGVAYRYDLDTFARTDTYAYEGEGWGLCNDGTRLVMSNGSPTLQIRDTNTFDLLSTVDVTFSGTPVDELNELECVDGMVWANIWHSSLIIEIDPATGSVATVLNARSLTPPGLEGNTSNVLNGIAYDEADDTFLLTGKRWPSIYRVRITRAVE